MQLTPYFQTVRCGFQSLKNSINPVGKWRETMQPLIDDFNLLSDGTNVAHSIGQLKDPEGMLKILMMATTVEYNALNHELNHELNDEPKTIAYLGSSFDVTPIVNRDNDTITLNLTIHQDANNANPNRGTAHVVLNTERTKQLIVELSEYLTNNKRFLDQNIKNQIAAWKLHDERQAKIESIRTAIQNDINTLLSAATSEENDLSPTDTRAWNLFGFLLAAVDPALKKDQENNCELSYNNTTCRLAFSLHNNLIQARFSVDPENTQYKDSWQPIQFNFSQLEAIELLKTLNKFHTPPDDLRNKVREIIPEAKTVSTDQNESDRKNQPSGGGASPLNKDDDRSEPGEPLKGNNPQPAVDARPPILRNFFSLFTSQPKFTCAKDLRSGKTTIGSSTTLTGDFTDEDFDAINPNFRMEKFKFYQAKLSPKWIHKAVTDGATLTEQIDLYAGQTYQFENAGCTTGFVRRHGNRSDVRWYTNQESIAGGEKSKNASSGHTHSKKIEKLIKTLDDL